MLKFLVYLFLLTTLVVTSVYIGHLQGFFPFPTYGWEIIFYMTFSTALVVNILQKKSGPVLFTQLYILTIVIKIMTGSILILFIIYTDRQGGFRNAILFITTYILYTILEVTFLYRKVNNPGNWSSQAIVPPSTFIFVNFMGLSCLQFEILGKILLWIDS